MLEPSWLGDENYTYFKHMRFMMIAAQTSKWTYHMKTINLQSLACMHTQCLADIPAEQFGIKLPFTVHGRCADVLEWL